ncbi:MAG TPA: PEP-CTERM sorting domain-containing protein [Acidobacteriaceae bacterium]|nr:PEP-CTERM sorting domain-containing protein [Acidobacteriaceae bacterium]
MRSRLFCIVLLPLLVLALALPAHADMDDFSITGGGATIDFSLPATTTQPCFSCLGSSNDQFNFGAVTGTVNGVSQSIHLNFVVGSGCAECQTILLNYSSSSWTIDLPVLYNLAYSGSSPNQDVTLTFVAGDHTTAGYSDSQPSDLLPFEIKVTPQAAATPEPATIFSLITAALALPLLKRRRAVTS